jgi:hypothetical protein
MPIGFCVIAPSIVPLWIASTCAAPESKPTTVRPVVPLSATPRTTPIAEPSFDP